jgi:hypothetical protein
MPARGLKVPSELLRAAVLGPGRSGLVHQPANSTSRPRLPVMTRRRNIAFAYGRYEVPGWVRARSSEANSIALTNPTHRGAICLRPTTAFDHARMRANRRRAKPSP